MNIKKLIRSAIRKAGYDIIRAVDNVHTIDALLSNIIRSHSIQCVIDVGANRGQYGSFLRKLGYSGHIVSFEPVSSVYEILVEEARSDPKWHCFNLALGENTEVKKINVYNSTDFSSFLHAKDYAKKIWRSLEKSQIEIVSIVRLDDVADEIIRMTGCSEFYLKMDTQGYDYHVFKGAIDTLKYVVAMQSELSIINIYDDMPDSLEMLKCFNDYGFLIAGMFPVNRDESLAVIEFDCVLVRRDWSHD